MNPPPHDFLALHVGPLHPLAHLQSDLGFRARIRVGSFVSRISVRLGSGLKSGLRLTG